MSEQAIQLGIQAALQAMPEFEDADVVINDWSPLDNYVGKSPYVIIENADNFTARQDTHVPNTIWEEKATLIEPFSEWKKTLDNLRTRRQAIIDKINTAPVRSAGGLQSVTIDEIRASTNITAYLDPYTPNEMLQEAMPIYLMQTLILVCEEY